MIPLISFVQIGFLLFVIVFLSAILGNYMGRLFLGKRMAADRLMLPIENFIYRLLGVNPKSEMDWKEYLKAILFTNISFGILSFIILYFQPLLPLNPNHAGNLPVLLNFTTVSSFLTNTNLQHYTGELQLSYFSQMGVITFLMFTSAATGIVSAVAFIRSIINQNSKVGNFYKDFVTTITRILIPISAVEAIVFIYLGMPQTFQAAIIAHTVDMGNQYIFRGPVASLESIKFLGTNGGGFYGADSSYPFENPGPVSNYLELITEAIIPFGLIFSFGHMIRNPKQARVLVAVTMSILIIAIGLSLYAEYLPNHLLSTLPISQTSGNWAGKDTRFSITESTFSLILNTYTMTGGPNVNINQMNPLSIGVALFGMDLQGTPGGVGTGLITLLIYMMLAVFISGLMVGRTPEFIGKKISTGVMRYAVIFVLLHPVLILIPTAIAILSGFSRFIFLPPNEAFTALLYEFTSAAANNGSAMGGVVVAQNSAFFYIAEAVVMIIGRYVPIAIALSIGGVLSSTKTASQTKTIMMTDDPVFGIFLFGFIIVLSALLFLPVLVLGPLAGFLGG
ncbi:MAG: potassium-transporting ATPase subunit A [Thermoplasmata archaeon]|nr:potassium-transporting ATPase subunit A [Candidatus Sysuiplasma jiujiangense]